jgi:hypothetical protein
MFDIIRLIVRHLYHYVLYYCHLSFFMLSYQKFHMKYKWGPKLYKFIHSLALTLALVSILLIPLSAEATSTDTTTLSGTVGTSITVTSPTTIEMPSLVAGTTVTSATQSVRIDTNTTGWSLEVADTSTDEHDGKLSKDDGTDLSTELEIRGGDLSEYRPLSSSQSLKSSGVSGTTSIDNIYFRQSVPINAVTGTYKITLIFTATPGH